MPHNKTRYLGNRAPSHFVWLGVLPYDERMTVDEVDPNKIVNGKDEDADRLYFNPTTGLYEWTSDPIYALAAHLILVDGQNLPTIPQPVFTDAQRADLTKTIFKLKAAAILRGAPRNFTDVYQLSPETPTMTVSLSTAAVTPSITNAKLRAPKRLVPGGRETDPSHDASFRITGTADPLYGSATPDNRYITPPLLTGGASQNARYTPLYRFYYDGQKLEWGFKTAVTSVNLRIKVDGKYITPVAGSGTVFDGGGESLINITANSAGPLEAGKAYLVLMDFGVAKQRTIEFEGPLNFGGVWIEPQASFGRGPGSKLVVASISDSIGAGAGVSRRSETWVRRAGDGIGADEVHNVGIGGTGLTVVAGVSELQMRIPDLVQVQPDLVYVLTGQNEQGASNFASKLDEFSVALIAALPNAIVMFMGMWAPGNASAIRVSMNEILRLNASKYGFGFIDMIDPSGDGRTAPVWTATTVYANGDLVRRADTLAPYVCTVAHTSTSTFDTTKWQATSWIYGTGKDGSPVGDGNADFMVQSDGIHQMPAANDMMERRVAASTLRHLRNLAQV